jgi:hypothetical protein
MRLPQLVISSISFFVPIVNYALVDSYLVWYMMVLGKLMMTLLI